jgi:hypothetical protein
VTLLAITAGLAIWQQSRRHILALVVPAAGTILPLAYYWALSHADSAWEIARIQNASSHVPAWTVVAALGPLLPFALVEARASWPVRDPAERLLLLWPPAALATYLWLTPTVAYHAFEGLAIPLAVLTVRGWRRLALPRRAGVVAIALVTLPGMTYVADALRDAVRAPTQPYVLAAGEARALAFLRHEPSPGGVLTRAYLGAAVPAFADRATWVGHPSWTPDYAGRASRVEALFAGRLDRGAAHALVRESGAAFVVSDCRTPRDLSAVLGSLARRVRRFGCATVYELRPTARAGDGATFGAVASAGDNDA